MNTFRHRPTSRSKVLCLWCGQLFTAVDDASYCGKTHKVRAGVRRKVRRGWTFEGCDAPDAPAEQHRGMAIAFKRKNGGELFICKCGLYHIVEKGMGGRSPELGYLQESLEVTDAE